MVAYVSVSFIAQTDLFEQLFLADRTVCKTKQNRTKKIKLKKQLYKKYKYERTMNVSPLSLANPRQVNMPLKLANQSLKKIILQIDKNIEKTNKQINK